MTPSPEPVSNFVLSAGEDTLAVFLTWLATQHPIAAAVIAAAFLATIVALMRWVYRATTQAIKNLFASSDFAASKNDGKIDGAPPKHSGLNAA